ncbi:MAG: alanine--tRNA ligase [Candidatus Sungbacteria bacterium]|nr:alanine--tRNA ligase [Candidatus Sungbacteria bacterium]
MNADELRQKFLDFFEKNGHTVVPSSSLIPDDPSVLLTTAGMQQFKPYYSELDPEKTIHPSLGKPIGKNVVSVQKSFRTSDIDEVGDDSHLTFFEMLGNFSFGGYFKKEAITFAFDFITKELRIPISFVTVFEGSHGVAKDEESRAIWKKLGVSDVREQGIEDVFWGPTGSAGPCGPTTEIYCENAAGGKAEIWNIVFNEFYFPGSREELLSGSSGKSLERLKTPGVDTGMGLERLAMIAQNKKNIFETDLFVPFFELLPSELPEREKRIIADHLRGAVFLIADGVRPLNKEAGYILRRLMRRALVYEYKYKISPEFFISIMGETISNYGKFYSQLVKESENIRIEFENERKKFRKLLPHGLIQINHHIALDQELLKKDSPNINKERALSGFQAGLFAFDLFQDSGFPTEVSKELFEQANYDLTRFEAGVLEKAKKHQEISRRGTEKKFGGHGLLLDTGELKAADENELKIVTRLHTATHMLQQALREVLGPDVHQAGSDITVERTRFDFTFQRKLTSEEIKQVEDLVNQKIKEDLPMQKKVLPKSEAEKTGALYFFKEKYPDPVNVYFIGKDLENAWSKEFCGGPHVMHTGEIGKFRIAKEEAVGAEVRRIRAVVE